MRGCEAASPWRRRLKRCAFLSPPHDDEEVCGAEEMKVRRERRISSQFYLIQTVFPLFSKA